MIKHCNTIRITLFALLYALSLHAFFTHTNAAVTTGKPLVITVTQGRWSQFPIAIPAFSGQQTEEKLMGEKIARIISNNLHTSGLFKILAKQSFIQTLKNHNTIPSFADWKVINANALLVGNVKIDKHNDRIQVNFKLYDVILQKELESLSMITTKRNMRRIAHRISDIVYEKFTGDKGYFDTQIAYIHESGPTRKRVKRLAIMDQDGENHIFLTNGKSIVMTPRFSPTERKIAYLDFGRNNKNPRVYIYNLRTKMKMLVGKFKGMTFAPRFSADGKKLLMSLSNKTGNSSIYEYNLENGSTRRITFGNVIDTSPGYSPDGKRICFNSDRSGRQQIYIINSDGTGLKRISFGPGRYATPVWSPRGDLIAFTKIYKGNFYVGVMRPDGSGERLISRGYMIDDLTWSPNGRMLSYTYQYRSTKSYPNGKKTIRSIDLTGYNEREIITKGEGTSPAWSPII